MREGHISHRQVASSRHHWTEISEFRGVRCFLLIPPPPPGLARSSPSWTGTYARLRALLLSVASKLRQQRGKLQCWEMQLCLHTKVLPPKIPHSCYCQFSPQAQPCCRRRDVLRCSQGWLRHQVPSLLGVSPAPRALCSSRILLLTQQFAKAMVSVILRRLFLVELVGKPQNSFPLENTALSKSNRSANLCWFHWKCHLKKSKWWRDVPTVWEHLVLTFPS